jgi:hypothetical protein
MKKIIIFLFAAFIAPVCARSQSFDWADTHLVSLFNRMDYWSKYCFNDPTDKKVDSLRNASGKIYDFIENIIVRFPASLTVELPKAKEKGLRYVSSEDNKVRIYSWQAKMEGHGTSPKFEYRDVAAYVYSSGRKYRDISNGTEGGFCTNITTIRNRDSNTIYIASYYSMSGSDKTEKLKAYQIENNFLKEISVFQVGEKVPKHLWCEYTLPSKETKYLLPAIHFNAAKTKLYVPATEMKGDRSVLTDKYLVYVFNGFMFVFDKDSEARNPQ